jgi:hypothetical protein
MTIQQAVETAGSFVVRLISNIKLLFIINNEKIRIL